MTKNYYVYAHINPITGKTFYIGKGTGDRLYDRARNSMWKLYVKNYLYKSGLTFETKILHICSSEKEALDKESIEIETRISAGELLLNKSASVKVQTEVILSAISDEFSFPDSYVSLSYFVKNRRKVSKLTQLDLSNKSGVGIRFVRELELGKPTLRLDKVNQVLKFFGSTMVPYCK